MTQGDNDTQSATGRHRLSLQGMHGISDTTLFHVILKHGDDDIKKRMFSPLSNRLGVKGASTSKELKDVSDRDDIYLFQLFSRIVPGIHSLFTKCRILSLRHFLGGLKADWKSTSGMKPRRRPDEVRWYFITSDELLEIQKRLRSFEALPMDEKRLSVLEIIGIITKVELRPA